jgi:3-oxoacyl-[acyl-carrier protein] reductase
MYTSTSTKVAIVTGGSRGIGKCVAQRLAKEGLAVAVNYVRQRAAADEVVTSIEQAGGQAIAIAGDVSKPEDAQMIFDQTEKAFGGVDVIVNNAGIIDLKPIAAFDAVDFALVINVNLMGTFHMLQQAAMRLRDDGCIINFSSSALVTSLPGYGAYNASKAAVEAITRVLSKELGQRRITVNAIAPGPVATELFFHGKDQGLIDRLVGMTPLGRLGEVGDIAAVAAFLAGPDGRWVTGQILRANGGLG